MSVLADVTQICKEAEMYGKHVNIFAHVEAEEIIIDLISVPAALRRQGIATEILNEFIQISDLWGTPLMLIADTCFSTPMPALHSLYTKAGFVPVGKNGYKYYPQV